MSYKKLRNRSKIDDFDATIDQEELEVSLRALFECENPIQAAKEMLDTTKKPRREWVLAALVVIEVIENEEKSKSDQKTG